MNKRVLALSTAALLGVSLYTGEIVAQANSVSSTKVEQQTDTHEGLIFALQNGAPASYGKDLTVKVFDGSRLVTTKQITKTDSDYPKLENSGVSLSTKDGLVKGHSYQLKLFAGQQEMKVIAGHFEFGKAANMTFSVDAQAFLTGKRTFRIVDAKTGKPIDAKVTAIPNLSEGVQDNQKITKHTDSHGLMTISTEDPSFIRGVIYHFDIAGYEQASELNFNLIGGEKGSQIETIKVNPAKVSGDTNKQSQFKALTAQFSADKKRIELSGTPNAAVNLYAVSNGNHLGDGGLKLDGNGHLNLNLNDEAKWMEFTSFDFTAKGSFEVFSYKDPIKDTPLKERVAVLMDGGTASEAKDGFLINDIKPIPNQEITGKAAKNADLSIIYLGNEGLPHDYNVKADKDGKWTLRMDHQDDDDAATLKNGDLIVVSNGQNYVEKNVGQETLKKPTLNPGNVNSGQSQSRDVTSRNIGVPTEVGKASEKPVSSATNLSPDNKPQTKPANHQKNSKKLAARGLTLTSTRKIKHRKIIKVAGKRRFYKNYHLSKWVKVRTKKHFLVTRELVFQKKGRQVKYFQIKDKNNKKYIVFAGYAKTIAE
ncbi:hypothetical protein [Secundilactobacillus kimchicus]|uniref:hypothetical protein n=1 Tax=Secundilactobacillus kimchicus TaxID=528209 RepID=UPI0024A8919C|nr:hypothetical protein [Secundilactobacillus kimchicus]